MKKNLNLLFCIIVLYIACKNDAKPINEKVSSMKEDTSITVVSPKIEEEPIIIVPKNNPAPTDAAFLGEWHRVGYRPFYSSNKWLVEKDKNLSIYTFTKGNKIVIKDIDDRMTGTYKVKARNKLYTRTIRKSDGGNYKYTNIDSICLVVDTFIIIQSSIEGPEYIKFQRYK